MPSIITSNRTYILGIRGFNFYSRQEDYIYELYLKIGITKPTGHANYYKNLYPRGKENEKRRFRKSQNFIRKRPSRYCFEIKCDISVIF